MLCGTRKTGYHVRALVTILSGRRVSASDITAAEHLAPSPPNAAPGGAANASVASNGMGHSPADPGGGGQSGAAKPGNGSAQEADVDPAVAALCAPVGENDPC